MIKQRLDEIGKEVRQIILAHGLVQAQDRMSIDIYLDISTSNSTSTDLFEAYGPFWPLVTTVGVIGEIGWRCTLGYDAFSSSHPKVDLVREKHLKTLIEDLTANFTLLGIPIQACQVGISIQADEFELKFADHPNLLKEHNIVQAGLDIEDIYSVIIIAPLWTLPETFLSSNETTA
jgi:hypothetical protein